MTVVEIVREYMQKNGYTALVGDGCGCEIDDLMPCGDEPWMPYCEVGYRNHCETCAKSESCATRVSEFDYLCRPERCWEGEKEEEHGTEV